MKLILLAAAAVIAVPAIAQTTTSPTPNSPAQQSTMPADQTMTPAPADAATTPTDPATMPADPAAAGAPADSTVPAQAPMAGTMTPDAAATAGGYQPAMPAMQGAMTPGMAPQFRAAPSPSEAYPAPAPMADYPVCKKGQFDHCKQGPASTHSREVRRK